MMSRMCRLGSEAVLLSTRIPTTFHPVLTERYGSRRGLTHGPR
jgi:hypothetical protein